MDTLAGQPTGDSEVALELVDAGMETFHCLSLARLNEYPRRNLWGATKWATSTTTSSSTSSAAPWWVGVWLMQRARGQGRVAG
jgi:hypothetical protein